MVQLNYLVQSSKIVSVGVAALLSIAPVTQAATMTGQVTGTWNNPNTVSGVNAGDAFTATFTYDDAAIQTATSSSAGNVQQTYQVALTSLLFTSGSVTQSFTSGLLSGVTNSNSALGEITNLFGNFNNTDKSASLTIAKLFTGNPSSSSSAANFFVTPKTSTGGTTVNAVASFMGQAYDSIQFTETSAAVPEPMTILGTLGAGIGLLVSKRQRQR
jgi:hypothetical protein